MSEESLDVRVDTLEREMKELRKVILIGNGQPSLVSQVSSLTQWSKSQSWITRTTLGAVVATALKVFFG